MLHEGKYWKGFVEYMLTVSEYDDHKPRHASSFDCFVFSFYKAPFTRIERSDLHALYAGMTMSMNMTSEKKKLAPVFYHVGVLVDSPKS